MIPHSNLNPMRFCRSSIPLFLVYNGFIFKGSLQASTMEVDEGHQRIDGCPVPCRSRYLQVLTMFQEMCDFPLGDLVKVVFQFNMRESEWGGGASCELQDSSDHQYDYMSSTVTGRWVIPFQKFSRLLDGGIQHRNITSLKLDEQKTAKQNTPTIAEVSFRNPIPPRLRHYHSLVDSFETFLLYTEWLERSKVGGIWCVMRLSSRSWHLRKVCKLFDHGCHCLKCPNLLSYCRASLEVFVVPPELLNQICRVWRILSLSLLSWNSLRNPRWACLKEAFSYIQQHRDSTLGILGTGPLHWGPISSVRRRAPTQPCQWLGRTRAQSRGPLVYKTQDQMAERYANLRITSQTDAPLYQWPPGLPIFLY